MVGPEHRIFSHRCMYFNCHCISLQCLLFMDFFLAFAYVVQMIGNQLKASADKHMYRLASVVQHFGRAGGGHYTVYRRVRAELKNGNQDHLPESTSAQWFGISDSKVYRVSEEDVLAADASLLFYEKISEAPTEF